MMPTGTCLSLSERTRDGKGFAVIFQLETAQASTEIVIQRQWIRCLAVGSNAQGTGPENCQQGCLPVGQLLTLCARRGICPP